MRANKDPSLIILTRCHVWRDGVEGAYVGGLVAAQDADIRQKGSETGRDKQFGSLTLSGWQIRCLDTNRSAVFGAFQAHGVAKVEKTIYKFDFMKMC